MEKLYDEVKELLHREISAMVKKGTLSPQELDNLYKAIDVLKDICEIKEKEDYGYSERGYSMRWDGRPYDDRYYDIHSYNDGNSYKRDSMGRYSRTDAKEHMIDRLYSMMGDSDSEADRRAINDCINRIRAN